MKLESLTSAQLLRCQNLRLSSRCPTCREKKVLSSRPHPKRSENQRAQHVFIGKEIVWNVRKQKYYRTFYTKLMGKWWTVFPGLHLGARPHVHLVLVFSVECLQISTMKAEGGEDYQCVLVRPSTHSIIKAHVSLSEMLSCRFSSFVTRIYLHCKTTIPHYLYYVRLFVSHFVHLSVSVCQSLFLSVCLCLDLSRLFTLSSTKLAVKTGNFSFRSETRRHSENTNLCLLIITKLKNLLDPPTYSHLP